MITQLSIENFKCFQERQEFKLSNLNIFAGINGRGKSTVFQSLLILSQSLNKSDNIETLYPNGDLVKLSRFSDLLNFNSEEKVIRIGIESDEEELPKVHLGYKEKDEWSGEICELRIGEKDYFSSMLEIKINQSRTHKARILQSTYPKIDKLFSPFYFISASRLGPTLFEEKYENETFNPLGIDGQRRLAVLQSKLPVNSIRFDNNYKTSNLSTEVERWCNYIMSGANIEIISSENTLQIKMKNRDSMKKHAKSVNMGFGYSYILSIIIAALIAKKGSVVFIENPEAHLHPLAQSRLMELLSKLAISGVQVNIETHSEHIINSTRLYCLQEDKEIKQENVSIYFFDESFKVHPMVIDENGLIENWPSGFFDLQEQQLMEILKLGLMKKKNES